MPADELVIPVEERFGGLKDIIFNLVDAVGRIRRDNANLRQQQPRLLWYLSYPWVVNETGLTADQLNYVERGKTQSSELGFNGEAFKNSLEEIRAKDRHLAECCPNTLTLTTFLDTYFVMPALLAIEQGATSEQLQFAYSEFESLTYHQGRFRRVALSHLFNFDMEGDVLDLGGARILRVDASRIPRFLGESGFQAFLHPANVGTCFVVDDDRASDVRDIDWLVAQREKASIISMVLQYFKDGVVHLGYTVPVFSPDWANEIRRFGLFFLGTPRQSAYRDGNRPYFIRQQEQNELQRWCAKAFQPATAKALAETKGNLREAIARAGIYYEASHEKTSSVERLIALAIALESLFSPGDRGEFTFRISQSAAQFVGQTPEERTAVCREIKRMYGKRSELFHGGYDVEKYNNGEFVTFDEVDSWSSLIRRALLGFFILYLKGETQRSEVLRRIEAAAFDGAAAEQLRADSHIDRLFETE